MADNQSAISFTIENADYFEMNHREVQIVGLIEKGYGRYDIARTMGISAQTIRDYIAALCEDYDCRTHDLPATIRKVTLEGGLSEISGRDT
jgi:DNA-binding NarL/FixJ family response regulator